MNHFWPLLLFVSWLLTLADVRAQCGCETLPEESEHEVDISQVRITQGQADLRSTQSGYYSIDGPRSRAIMEPNYHDRLVKVGFRFRGNSTSDIPLNSGTIRRQIGMQLASGDPCNSLYVMWEVLPHERISVFVKSNPGQHLSTECGSEGYTRMHSDIDFSVTLDSATDNMTHRLSAYLEPLRDSYDSAWNDYRHFRLYVCADNERVFEKVLYDLPQAIRGPAGLRTDNGSFIFKFFAG